MTEDDDDGFCTDCYDTGIAGQTERACSCSAGDQYRAAPVTPHPSLEICVQWSDDGQHIRKWSRLPFESGQCLYSHPAPPTDDVGDISFEAMALEHLSELRAKLSTGDAVRKAKAIAAAVVQSACESDPADPEHPNTIAITCDDLECIVRTHVELAYERAALAKQGESN